MNTTPTFSELIAAYREIAAIERIKRERPAVTTVYNVGTALAYVLKATGISWTDPITVLNRRQLDAVLLKAADTEMNAVSVCSYLERLKALGARWTRPYYEDRGWIVPPLELPAFHRRPARYKRPSRELLLAVKSWYEGLTIRSDTRLRVITTLMLEFAMRNGDIVKLTSNNFLERDGKRYLHYIPHKTEHSSGREVCWPVHPDLLAEITPSQFPIRECRKVFPILNCELRELGFAGSKALYELRKICIDHIYQKYGAEMASSISGDDLRTVTRYYADPSALCIHNLRVVEML